MGNGVGSHEIISSNIVGLKADDEVSRINNKFISVASMYMKGKHKFLIYQITGSEIYLISDLTKTSYCIRMYFSLEEAFENALSTGNKWDKPKCLNKRLFFDGFTVRQLRIEIAMYRRDHPDYSLLFNNCRDFAEKLFEQLSRLAYEVNIKG